MRGWRGQVLMATVLGISFCLGTAGTAVAQPAPAAAPDPGPMVDINVFFHDLSPYGVWDQNPNFGWVWYPNEVPAGWRPYTHGHWLLTDDGWTWASDWDWGWGPFHYGRWFDDANLGWVWVPGAVWAPAWVMWEQSEDYVGWAPLPPQVRWSWSVGLEFGDMELESMLPPGAFVFVPDRDFLDRDVRRFVVPRVRSVMILPRAHVVTRYGIEDGRIIDHGIPPEALERRFGHRITRYRIEGVESPRGLHRGERYEHGRVEFYRPHFREGQRFEPPEERSFNQLLPFNEFERHQEAQRRDLERRHREEQQQLEREQNQERRHPPEGMRPEELQQRQERERQFVRGEQQRERHQMEQRHARERQRYQEEQRRPGGEHERGNEHRGGEAHGGEHHGGEGHAGEHHGGDGHGGH